MAPTCSNCGASDFVWANDLKTGTMGRGELSLRRGGELSLGTRICRQCGHADLFVKDPSVLRQPHTWRPGEFVPLPPATSPAKTPSAPSAPHPAAPTPGLTPPPPVPSPVPPPSDPAPVAPAPAPPPPPPPAAPELAPRPDSEAAGTTSPPSENAPAPGSGSPEAPKRTTRRRSPKQKSGDGNSPT